MNKMFNFYNIISVIVKFNVIIIPIPIKKNKNSN